MSAHNVCFLEEIMNTHFSRALKVYRISCANSEAPDLPDHLCRMDRTLSVCKVWNFKTTFIASQSMICCHLNKTYLSKDNSFLHFYIKVA